MAMHDTTETTTVGTSDRRGNWGRWGDDDERGSLNLLTPDVITAAAASITTGRVYSLGIPIQGQGVPLMDYRGTPMRLTLQDSTDDGIYAGYGCHTGTGAHEDVLVMASHTTSHMDALVHVYGEYKHYNGVGHDEMHALGGAQRLGIDKVGGFAARAVLLDMVAYFGDETHVTLGRNITAADLQGAAEKEGVEVRAGDVVLIRTGYLQQWWANNAAGTPQPFEQAGIGADAARWLASMDVVAVGCDNAAVEVIPFDDNDFLNIHKILMVDHGIYLLEFLNLAEPAADGTYEGLLAVAPLKVTGATGSPVNPIFVG
jgi:kynurenine formamidase